MMASTSVQAPAPLQSRDSKPCSIQSSTVSHHTFSHHPAAVLSLAVDHIGLTPSHSGATPPAEHIETPSGSNATSSHDQASDFSDLDVDPFFGADFNTLDPATPSFLDDDTWGQTAFSSSSFWATEPRNELVNTISYPLTPTHTASLHATSPRSVPKDLGAIDTPDTVPKSVSPRQLEKTYKPTAVDRSTSAIPPSLSSSNSTGRDGLAPAFVPMRQQSPRVTISVWDNDADAPVHTVERSLEDSPGTVRGGARSAGDLLSTTHNPGFVSGHRDPLDRWHQEETTSRRAGLDPGNRPPDQVPSINENMAQRRVEEKNQDVGRWLSQNFDNVAAPPEKSPEEMQAIESPRDDGNDIPLGHRTENRYVPGQTYFEGAGGDMSDIDREIIASSRNWADAPLIPGIHTSDHGRYQPETSQAAIARFEGMCRDNDSVLSRSATWGTRRRSFPSVIDVEGVTSGNFLKKLSISRGGGGGEKTSRPGSFLKDLRGLVRRTSVHQLGKRSRSRSWTRSASGQDAAADQEETGKGIRRENTPQLPPPPGSPSSGKKGGTPGINTTLASVGQNIASMWSGHSRSGSVSGVSPMASPRASLGSLTVKTSLRRPRSKSELPRPATSAAGLDSVSSLVDLWRRTGGPPVAPVSRINHSHAAVLTPTATATAEDEDDDDDDELHEANDMSTNSNVVDEFTPTLAGFQQHVVKLNPGLEKTHGYLVDRIAHQQVVRYKQLLTAKVKHLGQGANCASGSLCMALGGSANVLNQKGEPRELDPPSAGLEDDEGLPTEGAIHQESFPPDIPKPPAQYLPAEFECQLCYQKKRFQKPSDWTKHVHEDVQPFTCTWEKCRDAKLFKRKADWVRHENEGHRHLEWWTCDVDDCRHTCYRRDNFLLHLVREHKFPEPKVKTKAAMKRAGGVDSTSRKVEQCHVETTARPQDEACRFCGKVFPSWKKLTVHLAKHMEQISLPILRLVIAKGKDLAADTIISPVQDAPPARQTMTSSLDRSTPCTQSAGRGRMQPQQRHQAAAQAQAQAEAQAPLEQQLRHSYMGEQGANLEFPNHFMYYPAQALGQHGPRQRCHHQQRPKFVGQGPGQTNLSVAPLMDAGFDVNQTVQGMSSMGADGYLSTSLNNSSNNSVKMADSSDVEPFPQLGMSASGLHNVRDVQMGAQVSSHVGYEAMMGSPRVNGSPFGGHESLSPYAHSPHLNATSSHQKQQQQEHSPRQQHGPWDGRRLFYG